MSAAALMLCSSAWACPGRFAQRYLVWPDLPDLQPGEVAVELNIRDFVDNMKDRDRQFPVYKVNRVLVGEFGQETIEVQRDFSSCEREMASGSTDKLVLVGEIRTFPWGRKRLIPRYMRYDDPLRTEAEQRLSKQ